MGSLVEFREPATSRAISLELLSIILIAVGIFIRLRVPESPVFSRVKERGSESKLPLIELLRHYPVSAILAIGVALVNICGFNIVITSTLSYVTGQLGVARNVRFPGSCSPAQPASSQS